MPDVSAQIAIPKRALFKAAEVCDLANVQPYVLRSWESEFPDLGIAKGAGVARVYRRSDVEQVLRIKRLLLVDGLTLAGARRKLEEDGAPVAANAPAIDALIRQNARERLTDVKRGLRSILELLGRSAGESELRLTSPVAATSRVRPMATRRAKPSRGKVAPSRNGSARAPQARRKRSA
jgi:DNA-binding transcriptional MerR regulator